MNRKNLLGAGLLFASFAVYGAMGQDLRDLPGLAAPEADKQMLREAIGEALENQPDNVTTGWKNPETGSNGFIRPVETYERDGMHCRKLRLRNTFDNETNEWVFNFCKTQDGAWKIAP